MINLCNFFFFFLSTYGPSSPLSLSNWSMLYIAIIPHCAGDDKRTNVIYYPFAYRKTKAPQTSPTKLSDDVLRRCQGDDIENNYSVMIKIVRTRVSSAQNGEIHELSCRIHIVYVQFFFLFLLTDRTR